MEYLTIQFNSGTCVGYEVTNDQRGVIHHRSSIKREWNDFVKFLTSVIVFALRQKLLNAAVLCTVSNSILRQKEGLYAVNLCAVNWLEIQ